MGRELQKRKARSSRSKVKMPNRRKKALNPLGNSIIAQNWNKKETLSQNYTRFGLVAKLGKTTGGTAPSDKSKLRTDVQDPLAVQSYSNSGSLRVREVKVERDPETGKILRIVKDTNPLNDPLNDLESGDEGESTENKKEYEEWGGLAGETYEKSEVLKALEREASRPVEAKPRHQSDREREWLQRLVDKHGEDVGAMARDMKLNPMQQTPGDLKRRLKKAGMI
ncbi:ribosome biogenesis protein Nop16 [Apiosordaria backusii]|uniref:Nucleolar protein 16 n=1 Tax=Apiosordaria backusii TaxID=314023 RepID=A0AA40BSK6_9PEZI|nr:ribosome biogenesis protein Nop16 [Apiosordaria backusii]